MDAIGFVNHQKRQNVKPKEVADGEGMFRFDSGDSISFNDGLHHTLVLGTTGSGKTRSVMLPALDNHIRAGHAGLVIDIKGNLRGFVGAIAEKAGRRDDIVEFGTESGARAVNLLAFMDTSQFYDFCHSLITDSFNGQSSNMDFHAKACGVARDCFTLLRYLQMDDPLQFEPNLLTILEMFQNPEQATLLFEYYADNVSKKLVASTKSESRDSVGEEHEKFILATRNALYHVLSQTREKCEKASSNHKDQVSYITQTMINALKEFIGVPGIAEKFCAFRRPGLDISRHVREGRIITLRFAPDTGPVGASLSRQIINTFYSAVYGMGMKAKRRTFAFIDEFQEVANLSDGRFSDLNFISQAREFNSGLIAATQSAASLLNRCGSESAVHSFISNCNNKIFFFTDDPLTREIAKRYDPEIDLINLKPGEIFAMHYDSRDRVHQWGKDSVSKAHESMRWLAQEEIKAGDVAMGMSDPRPSLFTLVKEIKKEDDMAEKSNDWSFQKKKVNAAPKLCRCDVLMDKYPEMFVENADVSIAPGWRSIAENALRFVSDLKLGIKITSLCMNGQYVLSAKDDDKFISCEMQMLNSLLERTKSICMRCGSPIDPKSDEDKNVPDADVDPDEYVPYDEHDFGTILRRSTVQTPPICKECIEKYNLEIQAM